MRIIWDALNERPYSQGVNQGVLYPENSPGVAWNGLISVTEAGEDIQEARYVDGYRYHNRSSSSPFGGSISAFTYPEEFEPCIGILDVITSQARKSFGFSYRTNNEIHLVYNALAAPSKVLRDTLGERTEAAIFEWDFTTQPVKIPGGKPSSHLVIVVDDSQPAAISDLEVLIYGDDENSPFLPQPADVIGIFESHTTLRVTDNGDGTFTVTDSGTTLTIIDAYSFSINGPSVILADADTYRVSSL